MDLNKIIDQAKIYSVMLIALPFLIILIIPVSILCWYIDREEDMMYWGHTYD